MDVIAPPQPAPAPAPIPPAAPQPEPPEPGSLEALVHAELPQHGAPRPGGASWLRHPPRDLFGLALSGGGIRSATYNLGLLQGLQEVQLLRAFDYVSTVSGGGYVGAFWTAWRHRKEGREGRFPCDVPDGQAEPREVRHLREFSNFLAPRLGIFSFDTGRLLVTAIGSMIPSLLAALSVIALAVLAWAGAAWLIFSPRAPRAGGMGVVMVITLAALVAFEWGWLRRREPKDLAQYLFAATIGLVLTALAWLAIIGPGGYHPYTPLQLLPVLRAPQWGQEWRYLLAPAAAWGAALLAMFVGRWLWSVDAGTPDGLRFRRAADRVRSRLLLLAALWAVVAIVWYAGVLLEYVVGQSQPVITVPGLGGLTAALAAIFAHVQRLVSRGKAGAVSGSLLSRLKPVLPQVLAYAVLVLMTVGVIGLIVAADRPGGLLEFPPVWVAAAALAVCGLVLVFLDPNEVGLHSFYRARLVRAYPGASNDERPRRGGAGTEEAVNRETEVVTGDDVALDALAKGATRPFHLVCCAANDLASRDAMAGLYRGGASAALSRVGFSVDGRWAPWSDYRADLVPTLGGAMTASGAAFNTLMGSKSIQLGPAVTFLAAALNLRLGLWVPNPGGRRERAPFEMPGIAFFREMFGRANITGGYVHLSDGGHFENMAVYELVRRHCRVIVASDCGMDTDSAFDDLGNLVRRVREDFGVEVRIDTGPLKPGEHGLSRQHMVAGDIHYPDGDTGVLLLFKPALVGDEPADVAQYRRRNTVFPHESTGDQFYDEAQWESYRRLGLHAAHSAFRAVLADLGLDRPGRDDAALRPVWMEAFARARREWQPRPEGFVERLSRFTDRVAELDGLLRQGGCEVLLHQVYKELDELDRRKLLPVQIHVAGVAERPPVDEDGDGDDARPLAREAADVVRGASSAVRRTLREAAEIFSGPAGPRSPRPEELSASLYLIRRALLLMAEMFESEGLEASYGHPLYLGVMNWFARWAYAPLFRMWWPLLKTMYPEPFTRFLEKRFSLVSIDRAKLAAPRAGEHGFTWIEHGGQGFASTCWALAGREVPAGRQVLSYNLKMSYESGEYRIQAAQLIAQSSGGVLVWRAEDFFVPPGLWGVGIGSDFLGTLCNARHNALDGVAHLVVKVSADPRAGPAARKEAANEMQLYRTAGFRECDYVDGWLVTGGVQVLLPAGWAEGDLSETQWMVAAVS